MADRCTSPALSQISPHARTECFAADCLERRGPASAEHLPETTSETRPEVEGGACANPPPPAASAGEGASREECGAPGAPAGSGGGGGILENQGVDDRLDDVDGELAAGADARVLRGECVGFGARRGRLEGAVPRERLQRRIQRRMQGRTRALGGGASRDGRREARARRLAQFCTARSRRCLGGV